MGLCIAGIWVAFWGSGYLCLMMILVGWFSGTNNIGFGHFDSGKNAFDSLEISFVFFFAVEGRSHGRYDTIRHRLCSVTTTLITRPNPLTLLDPSQGLAVSTISRYKHTT